MPAFPVDLRVRGRSALVVGGGQIAARRVEALCHAGAAVTVVSPRLGPILSARREREDFIWWPRRFAAGDCQGMHLVVSCVDDPAVGPAVAADAWTAGALVSVADVPELCDFYFGAVVRRGPVAVSVHTDGRAPGMAARLRDEIAPLLDDRAMARTQRFVELRRRLRELDPEVAHAPQRAAFLQQYARDEALDALREPGAVERALESYRSRSTGGAEGEASAMPPVVYLVGAGPGDPELLTVRAVRLIREADDLVVDALVPPAVYAGCRARVIYVGKRAQRARIAQGEIHRILIDLAREGRMVVRLQGGDPGVFGRIDEERDALADAGVKVEVVPGISSVLAAPAAVEVALTSRGIADRVVVMTGHRRGDAVESDLEVPPFRSNQTVVLLMGLGCLDAWVQRLLEEGYPRELPVVVVSRATQPEQQSVAAPLGEVVEAVLAAELTTPATVIIGHVAARAYRASASASSPAPPDPAGDDAHELEGARFAGHVVEPA